MNTDVIRMVRSCCVFAFALCAEMDAAALENPAFEGVKDGQAVGWKSSWGCFRAEKGAGANGSGGLVWESPEPAKRQAACLQEVDVVRGQPYHFTCSVRTENFSAAQGGFAAMCMEWYDADGKWMGGGYSESFKEGNSDWVQIGGSTRDIPLQAKTVRVQLYVGKGATGVVAFDNVSVRPLSRQPVAFVFSSAYRDVAASGNVRFHAAFYPGVQAANETLSAEFSYIGADGAEVRAKPTEFAADGATLALRVDEVAMGTHPVVCVLTGNAGRKLGSAVCEFTRVQRLPERTVWIDGHNRCIVNGKPFFPLGMYWGKVEAAKLAKYCEGPFNCLMPYVRATPEDLDLCREKGLMAFVNLKDQTLHSVWARNRKITTQEEVDAFFEREINKVKDHPALLGWYVNDEAPTMEIPERTHLYSIFRRLDPNHPTWAVLDRTYDLREFTPTYDVLGVDPYPVAKKPLSHITEFMMETRNAVFNDRPMWNVPQAFNWGWYRKQDAGVERFPTEQELKSMNWQHIALGANGLVSYCFHTYFRNLSTPEDFDRHWGMVCNAAKEVKKMMTVLLSVEKAPGIGGAPRMMPVRVWALDGDVYVLAVNPLNERQDAALAISEGKWKAVSCEVGEAGRMDDSGKRLEVSLPPIGVSFMRLSPVK